MLAVLLAVLQSFQPIPQKNEKKENVCYKTNLDLFRIPGHATQASAWFVRYTWASADILYKFEKYKLISRSFEI